MEDREPRSVCVGGMAFDDKILVFGRLYGEVLFKGNHKLEISECGKFITSKFKVTPFSLDVVKMNDVSAAHRYILKYLAEQKCLDFSSGCIEVKETIELPFPVKPAKLVIYDDDELTKSIPAMKVVYEEETGCTLFSLARASK